MVATHGVNGHGSGAVQKAKAYEEANGYCMGLGKQLQSISDSQTEESWGSAPSAELNFRCVALGSASSPGATSKPKL